MRLYAWAHAVDPDEAVALAARFEGLGLVLTRQNYAAAHRLDVPPVAFVNSEADARAVRASVIAGVAWHAVVFMDERNAPGPSGAYVHPDEYRARFVAAERILTPAPGERPFPPVHTMGLQPVGGLLRQVFRCRVFDDRYHGHLPAARGGHAFNPNGVRLHEVDRVLSTHRGPWVLSPAPFRGWWDRANEPVDVATWARVSTHSRVRAVALWCLREVYGSAEGRMQYEHGLVDAQGVTTNVGREVERALGLRR